MSQCSVEPSGGFTGNVLGPVRLFLTQISDKQEAGCLDELNHILFKTIIKKSFWAHVSNAKRYSLQAMVNVAIRYLKKAVEYPEGDITQFCVPYVLK